VGYGCQVGSFVTTTFDVVVVASSPVNLDRLTVRLIDGSHVGGRCHDPSGRADQPVRHRADPWRHVVCSPCTRVAHVARRRGDPCRLKSPFAIPWARPTSLPPTRRVLSGAPAAVLRRYLRRPPSRRSPHVPHARRFGASGRAAGLLWCLRDAADQTLGGRCDQLVMATASLPRCSR